MHSRGVSRIDRRTACYDTCPVEHAVAPVQRIRLLIGYPVEDPANIPPSARRSHDLPKRATFGADCACPLALEELCFRLRGQRLPDAMLPCASVARSTPG